jgi:hypothetical protein
MIADSNNFFFECDRSNSNAKIPHATVGRAAPATNRRRQSFTASLTCATRAGSSLLTAAVINTTHKTRPKAFKNIRALINRCPTGEHPFITRDWLFQPSLPCADQQDQRADLFRMMRPRFADSIRASSRVGLHPKAGHMTASDLYAARKIISCQAGAIHT